MFDDLYVLNRQQLEDFADDQFSDKFITWTRHIIQAQEVWLRTCLVARHLSVYDVSLVRIVGHLLIDYLVHDEVPIAVFDSNVDVLTGYFDVPQQYKRVWDRETII